MLNKLVAKIVAELIAQLGPILVEKLSALIPLAAASVAKAIGEQLKTAIPDITLPAVGDIAEDVRQELNQIPDIDVPVLSDVFDLTEWLKSRGR